MTVYLVLVNCIVLRKKIDLPSSYYLEKLLPDGLKLQCENKRHVMRERHIYALKGMIHLLNYVMSTEMYRFMFI